MYKIKQLPEDFIVKEISSIKVQENGHYAYFILNKINLNTGDALQILSKKFKIPLKNIGFAGNKDKNAITEQKISIFRGSKNFESHEFNGLKLTYLGNGKAPIFLGYLDGNDFTIMVRNLDREEEEKIKNLDGKIIKIPNLFGPQRFSQNNHLVGKIIIKRDFKNAIKLILENNGIIENKIKNYIIKNKNNYIEALRLIPLKTRKLFVHSYQSFLFNNIANEYLKIGDKIKNINIPIIGYNFEINSIRENTLKNIIKNILYEEKINTREFILNQIPELTSEGGFRQLFFVLNFQILEMNKDEFEKNKQKININFILPKGCYATVAIDFIFQS